MGRLAVVLGSSATGSRGERVAAAAAAGGAHVLQRHGVEKYVLPHRIDHAANLRSLAAAGCDRVLAIGSVGSLREEIGVGTLVCPDDFIALQLGTTTFEDARGHRPPGFDREWRARLLVAAGARGEVLRDTGVYWETIGPRFETPAEIRMIAAHADLVGMTIASECVIAGELGLPYAALCMVDNLANGIGTGQLSVAELEADRERNADRLRDTLERLLPELGEEVSLTVENAVLGGEQVGLRCAGEAIAALGPDVVAEAGDEQLDAHGAPLVAALVNGHTHAAMTLFRGYGGDLPLMRWLEEVIWPVEAKLEAEDVYWGTRLACVEMIRTGTARFWDMYWHPAETARATRDAGLRATIGGPLFDAKGGSEAMRTTALEDLSALVEHGPRIGRALAPHSIYTVSEGLLRWTAETAAEHGVAIHIHLSETEDEVKNCIERHGVRPATYLDSLGVLGGRTVLAHGVWLDRDELELVAERGCTVVSNPVANMKLAVGGAFPYPAAREVGVAIGLGTDGAGSNDSLDLFSDLKAFALLQRHTGADATVIGAADAWAIATGAASPLLSGGRAPLEVGAPADFLLLRNDAHELGLGDLHSDLVYSASGSVVDTTVVGGRVLMRGGEVEGAAEVLARAVERAGRLGLG